MPEDNMRKYINMVNKFLKICIIYMIRLDWCLMPV